MMKTSRVQKRIRGEASHERDVARVINRAWPVFESYTHTEAARQLLAAHNIEGLLNAAPWDDFVGVLGDVVGPIQQNVANGVREMFLHYQGIKANIEFNVIDALSVKYAEQQSGKLIKNIVDTQRAAVRETVGQAMRGALTVDDAGAIISNTVGLHPRWSNAVENLRNRELASLLRKGVEYEKAWEQSLDRAVRYRDSLVKKRAMMIARTEIHISSSLGRFAAQRLAVENGYAANDSRREWSAGPGACEICTGMSGEVVLWDKPYSNGELIAHGHPGCRCTDVSLPPEYGDVELDPRPVSWLDDGTGRGPLGATRFGEGGLTDFGQTVAPLIVPTAPAFVMPATAPELTAEKALEAAYYGGYKKERDLEGGIMAEEISVGRLSDGTQAVVKRVGKNGAEEVEREYLSGRVLSAFGVDHTVATAGRNTLVMPFIKGQVGAEWKDANRARFRESEWALGLTKTDKAMTDMPNGKAIGIFDVISGNTDRHGGNYIVTDKDRVYPIDHGLVQFQEVRGWRNTGPFERRLNEQGRGGDTYITKAELRDFKNRLQSVEPDFKDHPDWFAFMMQQMNDLIAKAPE